MLTTEPAAITEFSPTVTPPMLVTFAAIHTFFVRDDLKEIDNKKETLHTSDVVLLQTQ